jgi:hypothetical protein
MGRIMNFKSVLEKSLQAAGAKPEPMQAKTNTQKELMEWVSIQQEILRTSNGRKFVL